MRMPWRFQTALRDLCTSGEPLRLRFRYSTSTIMIELRSKWSNPEGILDGLIAVQIRILYRDYDRLQSSCA